MPGCVVVSIDPEDSPARRTGRALLPEGVRYEPNAAAMLKRCHRLWSSTVCVPNRLSRWAWFGPSQSEMRMQPQPEEAGHPQRSCASAGQPQGDGCSWTCSLATVLAISSPVPSASLGTRLAPGWLQWRRGVAQGGMLAQQPLWDTACQG